MFALEGKVFALGGPSVSPMVKIFVLGGKVFAPGGKVFALGGEVVRRFLP